MTEPHLEIERRWLLRNLPASEVLNVLKTNVIYYEVIYIYSDTNLEVRIQRRVDYNSRFADYDSAKNPRVTYPIVTKLGRGVLRQESPKLLADESLFIYYKKQTKLPRLSAMLCEVYSPAIKNPWEIKQIDWKKCAPWLGFTQKKSPVIAELEFDSIESAQSFNIENAPFWLRLLVEKEITDDQRYNMGSLAVSGLPYPR